MRNRRQLPALIVSDYSYAMPVVCSVMCLAATSMYICIAYVPLTRTVHSRRNDIIIIIIYNDNETCLQSRSQHPFVLSPWIATDICAETWSSALMKACLWSINDEKAIGGPRRACKTPIRSETGKRKINSWIGFILFLFIILHILLHLLRLVKKVYSTTVEST